jgi:hypothetical protein
MILIIHHLFGENWFTHSVFSLIYPFLMLLLDDHYVFLDLRKSIITNGETIY